MICNSCKCEVRPCEAIQYHGQCEDCSVSGLPSCRHAGEHYGQYQVVDGIRQPISDKHLIKDQRR